MAATARIKPREFAIVFEDAGCRNSSRQRSKKLLAIGIGVPKYCQRQSIIFNFTQIEFIILETLIS